MASNISPIFLPNNCNYLVLNSQYLSEYCSNVNPPKNLSNTYYLEHSTDTTAMKSFDDATSMTLWIAIFATILAWWFGKRSFMLTQQSFELSIKQIEASIIASSENTAETLKSNNKLIDHQITIQTNEFNFKIQQDTRQNLINLSTDFIKSGKRIYFLISKYTDPTFHDVDWRKFVNYSSPHINTNSARNLDFVNAHNEINNEIEKMLECLFKFSMITNRYHPLIIETKSKLEDATKLATDQRFMYKAETKEQHIEKLRALNLALQMAWPLLQSVIKDKSCYI